MGCALSNGVSKDSPPGGLEQMKMQNGYIKGEYVSARGSTGARQEAENKNGSTKRGYVEARRSTGVRPEFARGAKPEMRGIRNHVSGGRTSLGDRGKIREDRAVKTVEAERKSEDDSNGNGSNRVGEAKKAEEDELIDGWPKWLTKNIPREVLKNIVPKTADSYDKIDKVGQGTYSNVYKARDKHTGKIVALKKVRFDTSEPESVKFMAREIMILQKLDHPNIVKLEGLATSRMQYSLYLVFECMQTDLAKILSRPEENLTEPQIKCYMQQLLSGLEHCHERGILHRDIKGSNLLIDRNGMLKIADFGLANFFDVKRPRPLTNRVVTLWYRAPELLLGSTYYGAGIDLWSAGCLLAEMLMGRPILPGRTEIEQVHRIFKLCGSPSDDYYRRLRLSKDLKPAQTYKSLLHEAFRYFPSSGMGLVTTLLALDPGHRGSAHSALQNEFFRTSPLPCDLSGLPVIHVDNDDEALIIDKRKHRTSKTRRRRKKNTDDDEKKKNGDVEGSKQDRRKSAEASIFISTTGSSATSTSSMSVQTHGKEESPRITFHPSVVPIHRQMSPRSEVDPNANKNVKNRLPPAPAAARKRVTNAYPDGATRLDLVQRSASSREFRNFENEKLSQPQGW